MMRKFWRARARLAGSLLLVLAGGCALFPEEPDFEPHQKLPESIELAAPTMPSVVNHGPRETRRIALTFDACATSKPSQYDERVTKILVEMNVPATIFLGGKWMKEHAEQTRYLASLPQFELANHSFLHPHMTKISDEKVRAELERTQKTMHDLSGRRATLFRAPYGEINPHLVELAAEAGLTTVQFDLASGDADEHASKDKLAEYVTAKAKNGSIVVMHINRRGWHTAEALPEIIGRLRQRGFEFVTVGQLLAPQPQAPSAPGNDAATLKLIDPPTPK